MEGKKVSFGFMKTKKADKPLAHNNDERKDYIECVEEQSIKIVGGEDVPVNEPLVIPLKPNTLMKSDRLKEIALRVESALEEPSVKQEITDVTMADPLAENLTLDQMAERELLREAKKDVVIENPTMSIPTSSKGVAEGEIESTLDDYEAVPVQDFGVAMLRGMGWKPGQSGSTYKQPELRPKGLGLGAHKVVKAKPKVTKDGKQEEMAILKNSFVKITCGKYVDFYGKVVSLDEENGRVMVDIPLKKETVSLSEFMMHGVTKSEYDRESKVIRKHKLCVDEKRQIIAMHEKKMPVSDIARRLNIARNTVYLWITRWEKEGVLKAHLPSGRPRKLTPHKEASLFEDIAHKTNLNMSDLAENHGVSMATIRRHIKDKGIQDKNEEQMGENETDSIVTNEIDIEVKIEADIDNDEEAKRMTLEHKRKRIIELHQQKYTVAAIAKRLNIARQAVVLCIKCWKLQKAGNSCVTVKPVEKKNNAKKKNQRASSQSDSDTDHKEFSTPSSRTRENIKRRRGKIPVIEIKSDNKLHKKRTVKETKIDVSQSGNRQLNITQKENIIAMYKLKQPIAVIARRLKITRNTANMWIKRWKSDGALKRQTSSGRPPKLSANDEATLIEEVSKQAEDLNLSDLASNHGVSITTVRRCLKQHGINFKQKRQSVMNSRAKEIICSDNEFEELEERSRTKKDHLSLDRKIKILTLYEQKHSISAIARHLNVAKNTVRLWVRRWQGEGTIEAHVPSGRPRKLTVDAEAILKAQVLEGSPLQMNNLASSHGVSTTTIRRCLRANGLNTKLQKGNQDCTNLQNNFQDFYCNSLLTELDCEYDTLQDKDQNMDNKTMVTKMVCDRGTSLDPPTPTAPIELESNTVSDGFQDSCSGNVVTKIVCDRGTSPNDYENE